ncbi:MULTISPECIES: 2-C-methyl-D-erythritol 4-phosphate cytidylyltransferase [unclassified Clostridium]|uniref:2-C-methyl-D-erythritol 4-phosphate cytidylyltransferase n=1 Tax=unclassified Clostridium TaxID=2614128 RepID=UPI0013FA51D9|nr:MULTISPECIES: 2-C-methyl-D-erythritol 4-phosphate cytidylyltransferase [unclassified Clostridium]MBN1043945.1 2-C-methyl-D-erythritol 4-phosphate cytidylyltransferase [Clostridium botulinum]MBN1050622.1 2-C-methyl-D-erythritol 4-phosphate cytidylyltransferase [Clostridium botulinum]MBN1053908.1 2-C-methyl-D-erythritol 4-phosphate cytidylyltransferase [Clostridium botulinum]NFT06381.1 2-C-methyl-D-erythritol 4-phosphate cytidylyltransferase [Clostridium botulinum]HBJ1647221.1 2-C-methyl-D-er
MVSAIVVAGGKGKRMGTVQSKQYLSLNGKPILYYTIKSFLDCKLVDNIILVVPSHEIDYCEKEILEKNYLKVNKIVAGGDERYDSVYNGLIEAKGSDIVLIHDGVRPFVSKETIENAIKYSEEYGAAAPGVMPKDTIKIIDDNRFSIDTPNRSHLISVQTPQAFKFDLIYDCHKKIKNENVNITDDTMVVEYFGNKVYIYPGEYTNIKITTPEDLIIGEYLVNR